MPRMLARTAYKMVEIDFAGLWPLVCRRYAVLVAPQTVGTDFTEYRASLNEAAV